MRTILVFTAGDPPGPDVIDDLPAADRVIAADGGLSIANGLGLPVDIVVGDLDSLSGPVPAEVVVQRHPEDKDQTDLDLALELALDEGPDRVVIVGGAGGRQDHELATTLLLGSPRWAGIDEIDWLSSRSRAYLVRGRRVIHGDVGSIVSLIPMGGDAAGITTKGLRWDLSDEILPLGSTRGVSNVMIAPVADVRVVAGCLLMVFPNPGQP